MSVATYISEELQHKALWLLRDYLSEQDAREAANNIRSAVYSEVRDAINNAIGAEQDRMADDAVAERRGLV